MSRSVSVTARGRCSMKQQEKADPFCLAYQFNEASFRQGCSWKNTFLQRCHVCSWFITVDDMMSMLLGLRDCAGPGVFSRVHVLAWTVFVPLVWFVNIRLIIWLIFLQWKLVLFVIYHMNTVYRNVNSLLKANRNALYCNSWLIIHITIHLLHHLHPDMKTTTTIIILSFSGSVCTAAGRLRTGGSPTSLTSDLWPQSDLSLTSDLWLPSDLFSVFSE